MNKDLNKITIYNLTYLFKSSNWKRLVVLFQVLK